MGETCHFQFRGPESGPPPQARFSGKIPERGEDDFPRNLQGPTLQVETGGSATFARRIGMAGSFAFCTFGLVKRKFQVKTVVKGECRIERTSFLTLETLETLDKPGGAG